MSIYDDRKLSKKEKLELTKRKVEMSTQKKTR